MRINIDIDNKPIKAFYKRINVFDRSLTEALSYAMLYAEGESKQSFGKHGNLKVRTGRLRNSIQSGASGNVGWIGTNVNYGISHENGAIIRPKNGKYLKFQIAGQWKTVKQVIIPARPFLFPAVNDNKEKIAEIIVDKLVEDLNGNT